MLQACHCVEEYEHALRKLLSATEGADLVVYRSTHAAWPKWGNWGFAWPNTAQDYVASNHFVRVFNAAARAVLAAFPHIKLIDGYGITAPRADHTERSEAHEVGPHLAHHGPEVVGLENLLVNTLVMEKFCPSVLRACQAGLACKGTAQASTISSHTHAHKR